MANQHDDQIQGRAWLQRSRAVSLVVSAVISLFGTAVAQEDQTLDVLLQGLGQGSIASAPAGIACGGDCEQDYDVGTNVTLTATASAGSTFEGWDGDCANATGSTCTVALNQTRRVRARFALNPNIPPLDDFADAALGLTAGRDFSPEKIEAYLASNPVVNTVPRFLKALPADYLENWIMMPRSESLQTGTAKHPRLLLSGGDARHVFTVSLAADPSYPGSHPEIIEFMQWDDETKNFRLHEIVLTAVPALGGVDARDRGIKIDDPKCGLCHSTGNIPNTSSFPGTTGVEPGTIPFKMKPNWDTYDSWAGMLPFNRDRIYQGSVEEDAMKTLFNPWTWSDNAHARQIIEQLPLQPAALNPSTSRDMITVTQGGPDDGEILFTFGHNDTGTERSTGYQLDGQRPNDATRTVNSAGSFNVMRHTTDATGSGTEGRGVNLFDILGGLQGEDSRPFNARRVADDVIKHRYATGSHRIDVRPLALAITNRCIEATGVNTYPSDPRSNPYTEAEVRFQSSVSNYDETFFSERNGLVAARGSTSSTDTYFGDLVYDTYQRQISLTRRKADLQRLTFDRRAYGAGDSFTDYETDRTRDDWLLKGTDTDGLIQAFDDAVTSGQSVPISRLQDEVFQRSVTTSERDKTMMGGVYVDRERYSQTLAIMSLYRYFLEPLGVPVDRWSMGVRSRATTYNFADIFGSYERVFTTDLRASLEADPADGMFRDDPDTPAVENDQLFQCKSLLNAVDLMFASLPDADDVPRYTDVQRVFNRGCISCHGDLNLPPVANFPYLAGMETNVSCRFNLAEDANPYADASDIPENCGDIGTTRLSRPHFHAMDRTSGNLATSVLYQRLLSPDHGDTNPIFAGNADDQRYWEHCGTQGGQMPCGGPALTGADVHTVRRWITGNRPFTVGDPHLTTIDGTRYDFQAAGEFTLIKDPSVEVQVRQIPVETRAPLGPDAHTGLTSCVALNGAAAVRVGRHRITYQPDPSEPFTADNLQLRLDGDVITVPTRELILANGSRITKTGADGGIKIDALGGTSIEITPMFWSRLGLWYMNVSTRTMRGTDGLIGKVSAGEWLPRRSDGFQFGERPKDLGGRYKELYDNFGRSWRVTDETSLFDYAPGMSTEDFTYKAWPLGESPTSCVLPETHPYKPSVEPLPTLAQASAEAACADVDDPVLRGYCVMDVMALGDESFAEGYVATARVIDNEPPSTPNLLSPSNYATLTTDTIFTWAPANDDRDEATHRSCLWEAGTEFSFETCQTPQRLGDHGTSGPGGGLETSFPLDVWEPLLEGDLLAASETDKLLRLLLIFLFVCSILFLLLLLAFLLSKRGKLFWWALLFLGLATLAWYLAGQYSAKSSNNGLIAHAAPELLPSTTYYWKVLAEDSEGGLSESETRVLNTP